MEKQNNKEFTEEEMAVMRFLSDGQEHFEKPDIDDYDDICEYLTSKGFVSLGETKDEGVKLTYQGKRKWKNMQSDLSDFDRLMYYHFNNDLDYYLSEDHWNFHVNTLLYKNFLIFYEGREVGAFLDISGDPYTQPIREYTSLYGNMFNEAYRLCHVILSSPVPETKVVQIANQAATWKFKNLKDKNGKPIKFEIAPNVIDLIESYHILGMVNTILTLANDESAAVDRFLIALSVYKDKGLPFKGHIHSFVPYNEVYQPFIVATMIDGSYLRPGYDNKRRDEYLRRNLPWYKNLTVCLEIAKKEKEKEKEKEKDKVKEKSGYKKGFKNSESTNKMKVAKKITRDKPKTLKYYLHGNNGVLEKQRKRVNLVFNKFTDWGWIDATTNPDGFDALFEGEPRHCDIKWKGTTTILTILMQKLLNQEYITKQTGQSAKSMVEKQFCLTPNFDQTRLSEDDHNHIAITIYLLDINNPLPQLKNGGDNEFDTSDQALQEVLSGQLRRTKGI